jgi:hypothetical protein
MRLMPSGDYYEWYCEWCDSKNLTLRTGLEKGGVVCGACQKGMAMSAGAARLKSNAMLRVKTSSLEKGCFDD